MTYLVEPTSNVVARHPGRYPQIRMNFDGPELAARDDSGALPARRKLLSCRCPIHLLHLEPREDAHHCPIRLRYLEPREDARALGLAKTDGSRCLSYCPLLCGVVETDRLPVGLLALHLASGDPSRSLVHRHAQRVSSTCRRNRAPHELVLHLLYLRSAAASAGYVGPQHTFPANGRYSNSPDRASRGMGVGYMSYVGAR